MLVGQGNIDDQQAAAFKAISKCPVPSKFSGFSWLLLHNRIPTRDNLLWRRIVVQGADQLCVLCGVEDETSSHLFLYCNFALQVWEKIFSWLGLRFMLPQHLVSLLMAEPSGNKLRRQGLVLIWNAVIWALWRQRNRIIFENEAGDVHCLVEEIKLSSWRWWIARSKSPRACCMNGVGNRCFAWCNLVIRFSGFSVLVYALLRPIFLLFLLLVAFGLEVFAAVWQFP
jgi:hypothetical protein